MKKSLKNMIKLASKVTVYVPATVNVNEEIDNSAHVDATAALLSSCFGGATSTPALGYWLSDSMGLVKERTTVVYAYCNQEALDEHIEQIVEHCEALRDNLKQEAIALEVNGEMYFI